MSNSEYLGMTLEFDQDTIANNIKMGYLDCRKTFGSLVGKHFYFDMDRSHQFYTRLANFLGTPLSDEIARQEVAMLVGVPKDATAEVILTGIANMTRRTNYPKDEPLMLSLLEMTGRSIGVKRMESYTPDAFLLEILNTLDELTRANLAFIKRDDTIARAFEDDGANYKPTTLFDFISFYVLFVGSTRDLPLPAIRTLIKKFTPEFALSIMVLIYLHQLLSQG